MPQSKQPSYYEKKYFDTQFKTIIDKVVEVNVHLKLLNGEIAKIKKEQIRVELAQQEKMPVFDDLCKKVDSMEKRYIFVSGGAVTVGTFLGYVISSFL